VFSTYGSTREPGEPDHCGVAGGASRWFAYQAPGNGTLTIDTQRSSFNTVLAVYTGTGLDFGSLTEVGCNNDLNANDHTSRVSFKADGKTVYYIVVDGVNEETGTVFLNYELVVAPRLEVISSPAGAPFHLRISGGVVGMQTLQASVDLKAWTPILTTNAPDIGFEYSEPLSAFPTRFYRTVRGVAP
jgi:hypothetical protein